MVVIRYIELFAGIGGFRSALDKRGHECVFASEIDKYATQAYKTLYGGEELRGDITKIHASEIPDHDLLVGGFPCQAFSIAGVRKGFEDTRGTLFFEIVRIADAKRPKWLMLENVKGLLSHDGGRTFDVMCATLNDIGYAIDFEVLNSKHYGVPQNRERIFIMASRDAENEPWAINGTGVVAKAKKRVQAMGVKTFNFGYPTNDTVDKRLRDVLQEQVDEKFYLSKEKTEKLIFQLNEKSFKEPEICEHRYDEGLRFFDNNISGTLRTTSECGDKLVIEPQVNVIGSLEYYNFDTMNRVHDADGLSPTIQTLQGGSREPKIVVLATDEKAGQKGMVYDAEGISSSLIATDYKDPKRILEVRPVALQNANMQGRRIKEDDEPSFTVSSTDRHGVAIKEATKKGYDIATDGDSVNTVHPDSRTRRGRIGKQIANTLETNCNQGVIVPEWIPSTDDVMRTIRTGGADTLTPKHNCDHIHDGYRIRKLTPLECFRLQGFTDDQFYRLKEADISDSQLYKMAGNAVTVNVIDALAERLGGVFHGKESSVAAK